MNDYEAIVEVAIVGNSFVGKSSLIKQFLNGEISPCTPTIAVDIFPFIDSFEGQKVLVKLNDTAGREQFRALNSEFFRRAHAIILVYDITSRESFESLNFWHSTAIESCSPTTKFLLIGNKLDLASSSEARAVDTEQGSRFAAAKDLFFMETSASSGENVKKAFDLVLREVEKNALEASRIIAEKERVEMKKRLVILQKASSRTSGEFAQSKSCCS